MPYIKMSDRERLENLVKEMSLTEIRTAGGLNYLTTRLIHAFLDQKGESYQTYNDILGALEGVKFELQRRYLAPYENNKITENGDL